MKKVLIVLAVLVVLFVGVGACSGGSGKSDSKDTSSKTEKAEEADQEDAEYSVSIDSCKITKDYEGKKAILVTYTFKNISGEKASPAATYTFQAFQNNAELDSAIVDGEDSAGYMKDVKKGGKQVFSFAYELDDNSKVTIEVTPTFDWANEGPVVSKTYKVK